MTQLNETLESLQIEGLTHDGRGVGRHQGKTIFVQGAVPGDIVNAKITQQQDKFDEARLLQITQASAQRAEPFCKLYEQCGGCQLQHLNIEAQRHWKTHNFITRLTQAVEAKACEISEAIVGDDQKYRRRARLGLAISKKDKIARLGFRQKASNELVDIDHCPILTDALNQAIQQHKTALLNTASRAYKEITIVEADNGIFGLGETTATPFYTLDTLQMHFPTDGFIQVNAELNRKMVKQAIAWLNLTPNAKALDLFCGVGNFTLPMACQAQEVIGIEGDKALVETAQANATHNQINNATFFKADLFTDMSGSQWFHKQKYDSILLDPGRLGAFELSKQLGKLQAKTIVYVSCNTATLIRDVKELEKQGYRLTKAGLIDMFPHTTHTEVMVQLTKTEKAQAKPKQRPRFKI